MTGIELFNKLSKRDFSGSESDDYAQDLFTIFMHIGEAIYPLLEKAEAENKKLEVKQPTDMLIDSIDVSSVVLV